MIERDFVKQRKKEYQIQEFVSSSLKNVGHSHTKMIRTPLGEKIIIFASRPGLVVGKEGENIKKLTQSLKKRFELENPQIEISEVEDINLDAQIVAEKIASSLEKFGINKFKGVGHKAMTDVMNAGALGIEILISGKVPSARAKSWRFYLGYLKKSGDVAKGIKQAYAVAQLKSGTVGIQVRIMPPDINLPDKIAIKESLAEQKTEEPKAEKKPEAPKKEGRDSKKSKKEKEKKEDKQADAVEEIKEEIKEITAEEESSEESKTKTESEEQKEGMSK